ncbi:hypothetical protein SAMN05421858_3936 [Haladaptatus litoreus]|uniref:Uncharacterized protein n=1 Tax=Haladaptatus litoreus TaxID=553468 RepID=A0A1N7E1G8_9EURY|nr:hypothetical protein [Haladaptatus litoreus]SIR81881.1 hypothetical protein SAMN05421858_3936 [Haladaptatus litoreus]
MALHADAHDWTLRTAHNRDEMWELADEDGIREARLAYPSGWLFLTRDSATRELVRLAAATGGEWEAEELAHELDQSEETVEQSLDDLVALGVFREEDDAYRPNAESVVAQTAERLRVTADEHGAEDGFRDIASPEAVRLMLDALLSMDMDEKITQDDLHELIGLSRKSVWMHVERLANLGILEASGDSYVLDEANPVFGNVRALNAAVLGTALSP